MPIYIDKACQSSSLCGPNTNISGHKMGNTELSDRFLLRYLLVISKCCNITVNYENNLLSRFSVSVHKTSLFPGWFMLMCHSFVPLPDSKHLPTWRSGYHISYNVNIEVCTLLNKIAVCCSMQSQKGKTRV